MDDTDTEERVSLAIDWDRALANFGDEEEMVLMMIGKFEELSFNSALEQLHIAIIKSDFDQMKRCAYDIKSTSAYSNLFVYTIS